jgi:flagellar basal body P-ring formation protein FlgA
MRWAAILSVAMLAAPAAAETLVATRTIRAQAIIEPQDLTFAAVATPGALDDPSDVVGMEARVVLYAGRPIRPGDIGAPAIVERNQIVALVFRHGTLTIAAEGRALARGGIGDLVRVMNLASRNTVTGIVGPNGSVHVSGGLPAATP